MSNTPSLRFPEFSGEWRESYLKKECSFFSGGTPSSTVKEYYGGDIPFIKSGEISSSETAQYITQEGFDNSSAKMVKVNDLLYAIYGATAGEVAISKIEGAINQAILCIRSKSINNVFLYNFLLYKKEWILATFLQGGQGNLSAELVKAIKIYFPSLPEQQKIADFLTAVDEKITLTTDKISQLETYKRGMMQKLLSGELRFPGFSGEWREVKLGEIAVFSKGKGISKNDIDKNGAIKCIRYGELYTEYDETIDNVKSRTNIDPSDLVLSEKNDIIIPASGETPIDIATASCVTEDGIALGGDLNIVRTTENGIFLAYYLNSIKKIDIAKLSQGISVVHLYSSQLKTLRLKLPAIEEQNKIAHSISAIVNKITLEKEKLDQLKTYKQGLLQRMFV